MYRVGRIEIISMCEDLNMSVIKTVVFYEIKHSLKCNRITRKVHRRNTGVLTSEGW